MAYSRAQVVLGGALTAVFLIGVVGVGVYTDWLWFSSVGQQSVFTTVLMAQVIAFLIGFLAFFGVFVVNLLLAQRLSERFENQFLLREEGVLSYLSRMEARSGNRILTRVGVLVGLFLAAVMGLSVSGQWEIFLAYSNATSFGKADPLFGRDVSFYVFVMPVYRFVLAWLFGAAILVLGGTVGVYMARLYRFGLARQWFQLPGLPGIRAHLSVLVASMFLLAAVHHRLSIYELVYSTRGFLYGAGYADVHAQMPALWLLMVVAIITAALIVASVFRRGLHLAGLGVGLWLVVLVLGNGVYPTLVHTLEVEPSELAKEWPYIQHNIDMTRSGYNLDIIEERAFPGEREATLADVINNPETITNIRLWDHRPLLDTYNQLQAIRLYYEFGDVDIDRYVIDGVYRQVMLSARELSYPRLASVAPTWVNQRLQYTHGYGIVMSPVNEVTREGLPVLFVQDFPPTGKIEINRPQIYFGEKTTEYVIVNTDADEFDYPSGDENVFTRYQGSGGVELNSIVRKLAYAWHFRDGNIVLSNYINPDSQLLYRRQIHERARHLAPFLLYDHDPYITVIDGALYWIHDAYTHSDRYPYSEPFANRFNYLRNSVKVVTSAYDGSVRFYVADPTDPIIATYSRIFPSLFTPMDAMPPAMRAHIRYPEGLFSVQVEMYRTYHMQDPQIFYNREDLWSVPKEIYTDQQQPVAPYFVIMKLEGEPREEFLLMMPFTPPDRNNMIAWLAARSDGDNYGKLIVYKYPKEIQVFGPLQIESRINQDPEISAQLALWNQGGSRVIRGNLLVIPLGQSNLYVEPIYLQAANSQLPEMKRVVVASGNKLTMEETLEEALAEVFGIPDRSPQPAVAQPTTGPAVPSPAPEIRDLIQAANRHYEQAQEAMRAGDWSNYGKQLEELGAALERLDELTKTTSEELATDSE